MTAAMRALAVPANASRIPRVAIVRDGKIVDEQLFREAGVTIGTGEQADIVVKNAPLPPSFLLLERVGDRFWLRFTKGMSGRLTTEKGLVDLATLEAEARPNGDAHRIALAADARGKIVVGDVTFLFQLVPPPPVMPRPQLPLSVKQGIRLDWSLTILVAMSFLAHFGFAGALYSDWMDPATAVDTPVAGLIDDLARLPKLTPENVVDPTETSNATQPPVATKEAPSTPAHGTTSTARGTTSAPHAMSDNTAAQLAARAEAMEMGYLTAQNSGSSVQRALDSNVPIVDLGSAAARNVGATNSTGDLHVATGGPVATGTPGKLGLLAGPLGKTGPDHAGPENHTAGPTISVDAHPQGLSAPISDADRVVAGLRSRFRKCYQDGLLQDSTMSGKTTVLAKIGPNGEVTSAEIGSNQGLSPAVTSCLVRVVKGAQFTGNGATTSVSVPITFVQQK